VEAAAFARCDFCGARSRLRARFRPWPTGLGREGLICPRCRVGFRPRSRLGGLVLAACVVLGLAGVRIGGPVLGATWVGGFLVLPVLLIVIHELTHAAAGQLAGARIFEVRIGWHRPRFQLRCGTLRITVGRGLLRGGFCVAAFLRPHVAPWRYAVLYGAPMLLHLGAMAAVVALHSFSWSLAAIGPAHFFVFFNALLFLASARPIDYPVGAFRIPNDGKALLLLRDPVQAERWRRLGFVLPALYALGDGEPEEALARAREAEHLFPEDPEVGSALFTVYWALGYYAYALRFVGTYADAIRQPARLDEHDLLTLGALQGARLERWLHCVVCLHGQAWDAALGAIGEALEAETYEEARAMWLALRAYVLLLRAASPEDAAGAQASAREAYELLPWVPFVCGTFGAAQIEAGANEEGLRRLDEADVLDHQELEVAARNAWRAIGLAQQGRRRAARRSLREAGAGGLEVGPPPALLQRAEEAVARGA
jgi:hypothetical protein